MSQGPEPRSAAALPQPGPLSLTVENSPSTLLLRMAGDLDVATIGPVVAALERLDVHRTTQLILDLQELAFLDLAGLRTILRANDRCKIHDIRLTVLKPRGFAGRVFTLTRAHRELDLVDAPA
jgi:anti-anti-sigma factor